ncbi:MAG: GTP-binding protein [Gammaproteobacteria bacterium RIFCSPHIGHO2_12_FULL_37_14]|nr:MAG: GTP-binding protein [Gammaproteobacteria bacterium RIFCSPHIGHO2_12_FULL_37_14]
MKHSYRHRDLSERIKHLFAHFSCVIVVGARQVGKSTLLTHLFPQAGHILLDPVQDVQNIRHDPDLFLNNCKLPIIFDEVQYAPELVPALKRFIDKNKHPGQFLLTGSQQWGVLNSISESLAGRAIIISLDGFSLAEIADAHIHKPWLLRWLENPDAFLSEPMNRLLFPYSLYEMLWRGSLPEVNFLPKNVIADFHASYQRTYIERDIRLLTDVSDLAQFGRFVRLAAALTAQEINYSELGRDIGITPQTAKRWLTTLLQTFEWFEVPAYSNNPIKRISEKPKGYFADTGQVCYSQMISSPEAVNTHPLWGSIFENAVVSELRKQANLIATPPQFYHWRLHSGAEVDLVLERDGKFYLIEIKAMSKPTSSNAKNINIFRKHYPQLNVQKGLIIAPAENRYPVTENDWVLPWDYY